MAQEYYEIVVTGRLPPEALDGFGGLAVAAPQVETVLRGPLCCQAAMLRLLGRLECFRAHVIEVRRIRDTPAILTGVTTTETCGIARLEV